MATGDITISIAVAGGATKNVTVVSATRVLAKAYADSLNDIDLSADADYQVSMINKLAAMIVSDANKQADKNAVNSLTRQTFTAAS